MSDAAGRNVLFVVMDTVRKDHLTPYGYDRPTTPTLAGFAEEALVHEQAVAQAPWTLPVHASMFTGLYPAEHTATQEAPYLPEDVGTLAETLSAAGEHRRVDRQRPRRGRDGRLEHRRLPGERLQVRRRCTVVAVGSQMVLADRIQHYEEHVRRTLAGHRPRYRPMADK